MNDGLSTNRRDLDMKVMKNEPLPDIVVVRRRNLRKLLQQAGSIAKLCERLGLTRQRVHSLLRAKNPANIGPRFARLAEEKLGRPRNWMDYDNEETSELADALERLEKMYRAGVDETSQSEKIRLFLRELNQAYKKLDIENGDDTFDNASLGDHLDDKEDHDDRTPFARPPHPKKST